MKNLLYLFISIVILLFLVIGYNALFHSYIEYPSDNQKIKTIYTSKIKPTNTDTSSLVKKIKHNDSIILKKHTRYKGKDSLLMLLDSFANSK